MNVIRHKKVGQKKSIKPHYVDDVVVLPITRGLDVFTGKGWDQWSRFDTSGGFPKLVKGMIVSEQAYSKIHNLVCGGK